MNDLVRARLLGLTLEEFQSLVGHDPLDTYTEFTKGGTMRPKDAKQYSDDDAKPKDKKKKDKKTDATGSDVFETDEDVRNKTARELEHYLDRPIES